MIFSYDVNKKIIFLNFASQPDYAVVTKIQQKNNNDN
jgi:hypothetical protein